MNEITHGIYLIKTIKNIFCLIILIYRFHFKFRHINNMDCSNNATGRILKNSKYTPVLRERLRIAALESGNKGIR